MGFSNPTSGEASRPQLLCTGHPRIPADRLCDACSRPYCDRCLLLLGGRMVCGACKHASLSGRFKVQMVQAPVVGGPTPQAAPPGSVCAVHAEAAALAICERCGDFMCPLCTTPYEGRFYCLRCFELQWQRGHLTGTAPGQRSYLLPGISLALAIGALIVFCMPAFNLLASLAALVTAGIAYANTAGDVRPGRNTAVAALVLGGLALALAVAMMFLVPWG